MSHRSRRLRAAASAVVVTALVTAAVASSREGAAAPAQKLDREGLAKALLAHHHDRFATQAVSRALALAAGQQQSPGRRADEGEERAGSRVASGRGAALPRAGLPNVRVNDPAADRFQVDQTTQSETSVAVAGNNVAVGFNDSQQALFSITDGFGFTGYGYSGDGGRTFTDGGVLPNTAGFTNFGDPWLTSDRAGRMYFGTLTLNAFTGNLEIGVARSDDGGRTWSQPRIASPNDPNILYFGDKDAITTGRDPRDAGQDNVYATWDDFAATSLDSSFDGLPVATSTDHGRTWALHYADKVPNDPNSCSFTQYIGAQPLVDPANGTLYVAAEKIASVDPDCVGAPATLSQVIFTSTDAGTTFGPGVTVSQVTAATPDGFLELAPGQLARTVEFPVLALRGGTLWMAWNDGASGGHSHVRLAASTDGGATWALRWATSGGGDEIQPALSADRAGLHLAYYQRNGDNTLDTVVADSTDRGAHFAATAITTRPFPGVNTLPQFDPQIAPAYMGDYIANVTDGTHQYFAWGDNRDRVTNFMHPQGRNDPDVYFARR